MRFMGNSELRMIEFPLFSLPFLRIVFTSLCSLFINKFTVMLFCDGSVQVLLDNVEYLIIWHLSGPVGAKFK